MTCVLHSARAMARTKQTARKTAEPKSAFPKPKASTPKEKAPKSPKTEKTPTPKPQKEQPTKRTFLLLTDKLVGSKVPEDWGEFGELTEQAKTPLLAAKSLLVRLCKFTSEDGSGEFTLFVEEQNLPEGTKKRSVFSYSGSRIKKSESEINEMKEKKAAKEPGKVVVPTTHTLTIKAFKQPTTEPQPTEGEE